MTDLDQTAPTTVDVTLRVNGVEHTRAVEPRRLLSDFLRHDLRLTGTHVGCEHGVCGACTVLVDGDPMRSCLMFAVSAQEHESTTVEGLGTQDAMGPVQQAFIDEQAVQCGYCINGMIMTAEALLRRNPDPSEADIKQALALNLCRCGTHTRIVRASRRAATEGAAS